MSRNMNTKVEIVDEKSITGLDFNKKQFGFVSPYRDALTSLKEGQVLKIDKVTARNNVLEQARKLHLKIAFAESDGYLYAKIVGKITEASIILNFLQKNKNAGKTIEDIRKEIAKYRFNDIAAAEVMKNLRDENKVTLVDKLWFIK